MSGISRYWHLLRLDTSGGHRSQHLEPARVWFYQQFPDGHSETLPDEQLQADLLEQWQHAPTLDSLALLCLRCRLSHAIADACQQLVRKFGTYYQFELSDLLSYVLDDDGQALTAYRPLALQAIETYRPHRTSLETWTMHLTRNHSDLNQVLIERGLYRISDWAILNDTQPSQLLRLLGEFHGLSGAEIAAATDLLTQYHAVYRRDRILQRRSGPGGRCATPSEDQLRQIKPTASPQNTLAHLRQLAYWLRQYRIQVRGGPPMADALDALEQSELSAPENDPAEAQQNDFLATYRQQVQVTLAEAMTETLLAYRHKLRQKTPPTDRAFFTALQLFHCQGQSMGAIAPAVGLRGQVQVSRLMNLARLRTDVRNALLPKLQNCIQSEVVAVTSIERLNQISDQLEALLAEEADRIMDEAASEAKIPKNRTTHSLFARQLCQSLEPLLVDPS